MLAYSMPISVGVRMSCDLYRLPKDQGQIAGSIPMRQYAMNCPFPPAGLKWRSKTLASAFAKVTGVGDGHCSGRSQFQNMGRSGKSLHDLVPSITGLEGEDAVHAVELIVAGDQVAH